MLFYRIQQKLRGTFKVLTDYILDSQKHIFKAPFAFTRKDVFKTERYVKKIIVLCMLFRAQKLLQSFYQEEKINSLWKI